MANIDFDGKLDAISVRFDRNDVEFVLEVDGTEILRIELEDLKDVNEYNLEETGSESNILPIRTISAGKHILMEWKNTPADVTFNVTVKAKKTVSPTTDMQSIIIMYREKVT